MQHDTITTAGDEQSELTVVVNEVITDKDLLDWLGSKGIDTFSKLQAAAIPSILAGKDSIIKLRAVESDDPLLYGLPLALSKVQNKEQLALIASSSDRLAQIVQALTDLGLSALRLPDGDSTPPADEVARFDVLVGTPHTILNCLEQDAVETRSIKQLIFDGLQGKASAMLSDTLEIILTLVSNTNKDIQLILIDKTMASAVGLLITKFFKSPVEVEETSKRYKAVYRKVALPTARVEEPAVAVNCAHVYYDVASDLLAKPNLLCEIIEAEAKPTIIFCNTPSDADLVDIMLRKRGINSRKMIGHIPSHRAQALFDQLKSKEIQALVVTDIAVRDLNVSEANVVINYTIQSDVDQYKRRLGRGGERSAIEKSIILTSPLDFGSFNYLKKYSGFEFVLGELPAEEIRLNNKLRKLVALADKTAEGEVSAVAPLMKIVMESESRDKVISYLLSAYVNGQVAQGDQSDEADRQHDRADYRSRRGGGRDGREGRDDRDGRGGQGRGRGRNEGYKPGRSNEGDPVEGDEGSEPLRVVKQSSRDRGRTPPPEFRARMYIGLGSGTGFSEDGLRSFVKESGFADDFVKRMTVRERYTFVDVPEAQANEFIEKMKTFPSKTGKAEVCVTKAAAINASYKSLNHRDEGSESDQRERNDDGGEIANGDEAQELQNGDY